MTAFLATLSAIFYGLADFSGGLASRKLSPWRVVVASQILGLPALVIGVAVWSPEVWSTRDFLIGGLAGVIGLAGVNLLYLGLSKGTMALIAPVTGVVYLLVGLVADLALGGRLGGFQWAGMALAAVAVVLVSGSSGDARAGPNMLWTAVGAGIGFAGLNVLYSFTEASSGLLPLVGARAFSIPVSLVFLAMRGEKLWPLGSAKWAVTSAGYLDLGANFALLVALQVGVLSVITAISGLYPAVTVLAALIVLKERLDLRQSVGVGAALAAVGLLAGVFG